MEFRRGCPDVEAKPVSLMYNAKADVDIDVMRNALAKFKSTPTLRVVGGNSQSKPSVNDDLIGDAPKYPPVNIDSVALECPFIAHTLESGGADLVGEPQWHLVTALACHTDDPSKTVHRLCEKNQVLHDHDATEEKLGFAQRQREQRPEIGPPKCSKISVERKECAGCPHLALDTTPLSLPYRRRPSLASNFTQTSNTTNTDLPERYYRGAADNLIYTSMIDTEGVEQPILAFEYEILPGSATHRGGQTVPVGDRHPAGREDRRQAFSNDIRRQ